MVAPAVDQKIVGTVSQDAATAPAHTVLETQPMLSDLLTTSDPIWTIVARVALDIVLPIVALLLLYKLIAISAERAQASIIQRVQSDSTIAAELRRPTTLFQLVLLSVSTPAKVMLPPLLFAYTFRTVLNIIDLLVNQYKANLPVLASVAMSTISDRLVPLDAALSVLLGITGVIFCTWFLVQLKDILVSEVFLVRAARTGQKDLERVLVPVSSLITWAAVLAALISILGTVGINLRPLLAIGGAGGIAAGLASQQLLQNVVSGVNIFLTRPFVVGDQVLFAGGVNIDGTVQGVDIMRTIVKTNDGAVVAVPNKMVAEVVVHNRSKALADAVTALTSVENATLTVVPVAVRRVVCFTVRVKRDLETQLDAVRGEIKQFLESAAAAKKGSACRLDTPAQARQKAAGALDAAEAAKAAKEAEAAAAAEAAEAAAAAAAEGKDTEVKDKKVAKPDKGEQQSEPEDPLLLIPPAEPLRLYMLLSKLTESNLDLKVTVELQLTGGSVAAEHDVEETLIGVSSLVRDKYDGLVLW